MNEIVKKNGISFGVGMGVFSIVVTALIYAVDISMFASWWLGLSLLAIYLVVDVVLLTRTKKQMGGQMSFKEGFTVFFLAAVLSIVISTAFNYLLFNVIDPGAKETMKEITLKSTVDMMEKFGAPASEINKTVEKMADQDNYSPGSLLMGMAVSLCISAVLGLIFALIFKSRPTYKE